MDKLTQLMESWVKRRFYLNISVHWFIRWPFLYIKQHKKGITICSYFQLFLKKNIQNNIWRRNTLTEFTQFGRNDWKWGSTRTFTYNAWIFKLSFSYNLCSWLFNYISYKNIVCRIFDGEFRLSHNSTSTLITIKLVPKVSAIRREGVGGLINPPSSKNTYNFFLNMRTKCLCKFSNVRILLHNFYAYL